MSVSRVRQLFEEAISVPAAERETHLAKACGDDAIIRAEVAALLRASERAGGFLESPTGGGARAPTPDTPGCDGPGAVIGSYQLLEAIGQGGFGMVYLAEQSTPVRRLVALKIIKPGMDTRAVIARFEAERQALAIMDHPSIAKVFDAGATDTGRPFFVMELVRGEPITAYCKANGLPIGGRLDLFRQVCLAVQHAHTKGIIHRDLKPSNILITVADGRPIPKVIDFGIAKATSGRLTEKTLFTEHRQLIGTPEYMSPEQAEMGATDIDTRSDVYSLGVLLYELLTGVPPFDPERLRSAAYGEMQRIIRDEEPAKPSTRLSTPASGAGRGVEPGRLGALIRGELDSIVMRCLEKDPARRYQTAAALAQDLGRHLAGAPVEAAPPSAAYRARKFVARHRGTVAAAAAVALVLLAGIAGTGAALAWALRQRDLAQTAAAEARAGTQRAQEERAKAERVADFMKQMLEFVRPETAQGRDTTLVRAMLDAAAERIRAGELKGAPDAELRLRWSIAETYRNIAEYEAAERIARGAAELAEATYQGDHESLVKSWMNLGSILTDRGKFAESAPYIERSFDMAKRIESPGSQNLAIAANNIAHLRWVQGRIPEAESLFAQVVEMYRAAVPGDYSETAKAIYNHAVQLQSLGRGEEAVGRFRESLEMYRRSGMEVHQATSWALVALGHALMMQGKHAAAGAELEAGIAMQRTLYPDGHSFLVVSLSYLAELRQIQGRSDEAESLARDAAATAAKFNQGDPASKAQADLRLASILSARGNHGEAVPLVGPAVAALQRSLPATHGLARQGLDMAAGVLVRAGEFATAEPMWDPLESTCRHASLSIL